MQNERMMLTGSKVCVLLQQIKRMLFVADQNITTRSGNADAHSYARVQRF